MPNYVNVTINQPTKDDVKRVQTELKALLQRNVTLDEVLRHLIALHDKNNQNNDKKQA